MSRIAKAPIIIPSGVEVGLNGQVISIKSITCELTRTLHQSVEVKRFKDSLIFSPRKGFLDGWAQAGTSRSLVDSMILGVIGSFFKKIQLVGVGYRVSLKDNRLNLTLGFSHTIEHVLPAGITAECLSQTEILLKGANKQLLGQVAANIRAYRPPEPYKGKGIRYFNETVRSKEAKKK
ncbi:50S ribosomal protein L6 [Candidatus Erwinia haradaeae]|uniref:50S ribosomal protein L6 n=1 Tax=Candidatus Erwinia haradaeae TaxID=1922217 RepID=A0A451D7W3_9GAMM|nr:50S ribosomal protein L6 [Candidatus Erwinia haradaeae]VFP81941.1 50S ribosomal protein L6 [Candidatus Erwinia haradaeae]